MRITFAYYSLGVKGYLAGQNIGFKELNGHNAISARTAFALARICFLTIRRKVRCHTDCAKLVEIKFRHAFL
jgi:hypothetical protein